jgi:hypothetical protein
VIITLKTLSSGKDSTVGVLTSANFVCLTCEDEQREIKVPGETRIPAGRYEIKLRTEGKMHQKYSALYPEHKGMLWLQNVENFEYVYLHTGNTDDQTEGCILVGFGCDLDSKNGGGTITRSVEAYRALYAAVLRAMAAGEKVFIEVQR